MPSPRDDGMAPGRRERSTAGTFLGWNRRIHYFLGLYLLFFTWLFVFTGLLLNHPRWQFAQFWPNRVQTTAEHHVQAPAGASDVERARDLMRQLGIAGEIQWPAQPPGPFAFQVSRPGLVLDVKADLEQGRATVQRTELNGWGVLHLLHTFTGVRSGDARNPRDWTLTTVWALAMDAVALGLIVMVFSSYIMWYRLRTKRLLGIVVLLLGVVSCGAFIGAVQWLL
ncbi:MAG: hypothetical protein ABIX28_07720 [Vicinamibacterales bacterium]